MLDPIKRAAHMRERIHIDSAASRQLTNNTHQTGLHGEFAFAELCGVYPDLSTKHEGDGGIDFVIPLMFSIDVKTRNYNPAWQPFYMLVETGKVDADIYVLALLDQEKETCYCHGWMYGAKVKTYPVADVGTGVKNHQVPMNDLRPMEELIKKTHRWKNY